MSRAKDTQKDFIDKQVEERIRQTWAEKNVSISFEHELPNDHYSPDGIKDKNDRLLFYEHFREKMHSSRGRPVLGEA